MNFPNTNKVHKQPIPEIVESNAKVLENHLKSVNWQVFGKAYLVVLGYVLLTIFSVVVVLGLARAVVNLFS